MDGVRHVRSPGPLRLRYELIDVFRIVRLVAFSRRLDVREIAQIEQLMVRHAAHTRLVQRTRIWKTTRWPDGTRKPAISSRSWAEQFFEICLSNRSLGLAIDEVKGGKSTGCHALAAQCHTSSNVQPTAINCE
eukprot:6182450-Pleurochrysis_carterae.AAC.2